VWSTIRWGRSSVREEILNCPLHSDNFVPDQLQILSRERCRITRTEPGFDKKLDPGEGVPNFVCYPRRELADGRELLGPQ
jgi:hypothetical protein